MALPKVNIIGVRYDTWVVIEYAYEKYGDRYWLCRCDCGAEKIIAKKTLNRGKLKKCDCQSKSSPINLIGKRFGRLTVVSQCGTTPELRYTYKCKCDCGESKDVYSFNLIHGKIQSCGCFYRESNSTHGYASLYKGKTPEYVCWIAMKQRCSDVNFKGYKHYGGRAITVCDRWLESFENFLHDMGVKPGIGYSIERDNVNGNYEPSNCRWATTAEQGSNRRNNVIHIYKNKEYIQERLAEKLKISSGTLCTRLKKHSIEYLVEHYIKKNNLIWD